MKFSTLINCMDGRTQLPANSFMKKKYNSEFVDTITEAGPVKILAEQSDPIKVKSIVDRLSISVNRHCSKAISIVAHYDCAGNPLGKEEQINQLKKSIDFIKSQFPNVEVIGLWIGKTWVVEEIK